MDRIRVPAGQDVTFRLRGTFNLERLSVDGQTFAAMRDADGAIARWQWRVRAPAGRAALVEIIYAGPLDALDTSLDHRQVLGLSNPVAGPDGAFLPSATLWYPQSDRAAMTYRIKVVMPPGFRAVAPGKLVHEVLAPAGLEVVFESSAPLRGIDLIAGPYSVAERAVRLGGGREVRARTYFHPELEPLAQGYLDSAAAFLGRYDKEIGPYAFASYSIVSSPLPTGFGMPGIAYLGRQVLRMPFIRTTSLGHEVLHDWWGNGVFPDDTQGNWSEGLTTLLADYAFKEDEGSAAARAMRLGWLRDYAAVRPEQDRALSAFISRNHGADQALGYNKSAFVFLMLRDLMGKERFEDGLRRIWLRYRFRVASWDDLRREFESVAQRDLRDFFSQWVTRPGAPSLAVAAARRGTDGGGHRVTLELRQTGMPYRLNVPLRADLDDGSSFDTAIVVHGARTEVTFEVPRRALSVAIDPEARLFRRLDPQELAPILRRVMLDPRTTVAIAGEDRAVHKAAVALAEATLEHGVRAFIGFSPGASTPVFIIGLNTDVTAFLAGARLPPVPDALRNVGSAFAYAWQTDDGRDYAVVGARDVAALAAVARSLPHLGAQSYATFEGARSIKRGVWPREARRFPVLD